MIDIERLCAEFARQAAISSPSFREGEMAAYLMERFTALGGEVITDGAAASLGGDSDNLIVRLAGTRPGEPLLLSVHMDTVTPCEGVVPVLAEGRFRSAGGTVLGADDKAGIAELIAALETVQANDIPYPPLEIVVTVCEEVGLLGAKHLDYALLTARRGIALDTSGIGKLIRQAPGANKFKVVITGREAHAGIAPEQGISAIETAGKAIARMRLGRLDHETTANIGSIRGGMATNIVAKEVCLEGEVRSHDSAKLQATTEQILHSLEEAAQEMTRAINGEPVRPEIRTEVTADYPIMKVAKDSAIIRLIEAAAASIGQPLMVTSAGGGSDANIFNQHGIETVILATGMTDVHTCNESVGVADMVKVTELLVEVLRTA